MECWHTHWQFKTANFTIKYETGPEYDLDLSWDEDGETAEKLEQGLLCAFVARVAVYFDGWCLGEDYLGGCIYESPEHFIDHRGGRGSYFRDLVTNAIEQARAEIARKRLVLKTTHA